MFGIRYMYKVYIIDIVHMLLYHRARKGSVNDMQTLNATEVRKNWSQACDDTRIRPSIIKRTHDRMFLSSVDNMLKLLSYTHLDYLILKEDDGSYTASLISIDLAENEKTREKAVRALAEAIYEYAEEYYDNYELYGRSPNRAPHLPYVTKALLLGSAEKIMGELVCQNGAN